MKEFDPVQSAAPASLADTSNLVAVPPLAQARRPTSSTADSLSDLPALPIGDKQRLREFHAQFKHGRNPYIVAAGPIIDLILVLNEGARHDDPHALRRIAASEIQAFHNRMVQQAVAQQPVQIASYALCSALDEAVLTTDWGGESHWRTETLLWMFHDDGTGGENVFTYLEELIAQPDGQLDLIELVTLLLDLGFQGHYRIAPDGAHVLESIRIRLHEIIAANQMRPLNPLGQPEPETAGNAPRSHTGQMIAALFAALFLLSVYLNLHMRTQLLTEPLLNRTQQLIESYQPAPSSPPE